jgi:hypothetical protein
MRSNQQNVSYQRKAWDYIISVEFHQRFEKELIPIILKLFQAIEKERMFPNSLDESSINLDSKSRKNSIKKNATGHFI